MTHQETAKHFRNRLKHCGINAKCSIYTACGTRWIRVITPEYGAYFNANQLFTIGLIAQACKLTGARRSEIDMDVLVQMTKRDQFDFEYHS